MTVWEDWISPRSSRTCLVQSSPLDLDKRSDTPRGKTREQNLQIHPDKFYASTCKIRLSLQIETLRYNPRERVQNECKRSLLTKAQGSRHNPSKYRTCNARLPFRSRALCSRWRTKCSRLILPAWIIMIIFFVLIFFLER